MKNLVKFRHARHPVLYQEMLDILDRIEVLAHQAESGFWEMARADWEGSGRVSHLGATVAKSVCENVTELCDDLMTSMAVICAEGGAYEGLNWSINTNALYVSSDNAPFQSSRVLASDGVIAELRNTIKKMREWYYNAYSGETWEDYTDALSLVYFWALDVVYQLGPNFPAPYTAFYSIRDIGADEYERPRIGATFNEDNDLLTLTNLVKYDEDDHVAFNGSLFVPFSEIGTGDTVHVVNLGIEGYEDWEDRIYEVDSVNASGLHLVAPTEDKLVPCVSEIAQGFGEVFLIRKVRGA